MTSPAACRALFIAALLFVSPFVGGNAAAQDAVVFRREHVLGTSFHLAVHATPEAAAKVETAIVREIDRLSLVLSTYDPKSEIERLSRPGAAQPASFDLRAVLRSAEFWMERSKGVFHPGVAVFADLWRQAAARGETPKDEDLASARKALPEHLWRVDDKAQTIDVLSAAHPTIDALAKGYILDRAAEAGRAAGAADFVLMIGGDTVVSGTTPELLAVADPRTPADNAAPLGKIRVRGRAVATSGAYARGVDILGKHYSHIFDPRTGRPAEAVLQATVVAPNAVDADAVATILSILAPPDGLAFVATLSRVDCLVVDRAGKQHASPGWAKLALPADAVSATPGPWPDHGEVAVRFEIAKPESGGRGGYRRPYVAVWVEDVDDRPVRTLCLWVERERWIPDLRRWGRLYDGRYDEAAPVTRATRAPGRYDLIWDGRDDRGNALPRGAYTIVVEAVREHGGYEILKLEVQVDGRTFEKTATGSGGELESAGAVYRTRKDAK